jgi:PIN domain nuclease of toxin-antitoxin system
MSYLLDTNAFMFWLQDSRRLSSEIVRTIQDNTVYISAVTVWEITIKIQVKKLNIKGDYFERIEKEGFFELPVTHQHINQIKKLSMIHKDPFDRLLIAQGIHEHLTIITSDSIFRKYPGSYIIL